MLLESSSSELHEKVRVAGNDIVLCLGGHLQLVAQVNQVGRVSGGGESDWCCGANTGQKTFRDCLPDRADRHGRSLRDPNRASGGNGMDAGFPCCCRTHVAFADAAGSATTP